MKKAGGNIFFANIKISNSKKKIRKQGKKKNSKNVEKRAGKKI